MALPYVSSTSGASPVVATVEKDDAETWLCREKVAWGASQFQLQPVDRTVVYSLINSPQPEFRVSPTATVPAWLRKRARSCDDAFSVMAFGWPVRCLYYESHGANAFAQRSRWGPSRAVVRGGLSGPRGVIIPVTPIWHGLMLNMTVATLAYWSLVVAIAWVRRYVVRGTGCIRCDGCGYDLRLIPAKCCPECGANRRS